MVHPVNLLLLFLKSSLTGLVIFAPFGPATPISVRRVLERGFWAGFISGLGAVTADTICAFLAGFGTLSIINIINNNRLALAGVSALFLFIIGTSILLSPPKVKKPEVDGENGSKSRWKTDFLSIFFLIITNPTTLLQFFIVFPWLGLSNGNGLLNLSVAVLGLITSGLFWWIFVCLLANYGRTKLSPQTLGRLDRLLGFIVLIIAVVLLLSTQVNKDVFNWLYHFIT